MGTGSTNDDGEYEECDSCGVIGRNHLECDECAMLTCMSCDCECDESDSWIDDELDDSELDD